MNKRIKWLSLVVTLVMLIAVATPVYAQTETDPQEEPPVVEESNDFLDHPIVKVLTDFFGSFFEPEVVEEPEGVDEGTGEEPGDPPGTEGEGEGEEPLVEEPTPTPPPPADEQIASLHSDEDLGFGEITKLLQIAVEAEIACSTEGINCDVTLDSLMEEYESGEGFGELFAKYGKPSITGVGQAKKEYDENGERIKNNNRNTNRKNKDK